MDDDLDRPDADAGPADPGNRQPKDRTLLMLPGTKPSAMAMIARLLGTNGHVVPQPGYLLLVLQAGVDGRPLAEQLSRALRKRSDVLLVRLSQGYLAAERWQNGELVDRPPAGLIAQSLPDEIPLVLSGHRDPAALPGAVAFGGAAGTAGERPSRRSRWFGRG